MTSSTKPIVVRFEKNLVQVLEEFAREQHMTKTEFIQEAVHEKLEDIYDIARADKSYQEWLDGGKKTYSFEEAMKRYG